MTETPVQAALSTGALADDQLPAEVEGHSLGPVLKLEFSRGMVEAECECSNPDGEGSGLVRFTGYSTADLQLEFEDHLSEL